ncbi:MAG: ribosome assembly factor SBDS [Methanosarcinales archaeon Met12]|nr:MAG: ribosome assembly factor SBDS [Methanosarcinales archaeon Met12]
MVAIDKAVTARYKKHGVSFEILVDPEMAIALKRGEEGDISINMMLAAEDVFEDASRGDRASEEDLIKAFGTTDIRAITKEIILHGDLQLTSEQRKRMQEDKRKRVIDVIAQNAINPQTGAPHPPARIEKAMEEAGVHIDPFKSVDEMVKEVMKKIRPIIPIRFEEVNIAVKIPSQYAAKSYGEIASFGSLQKQEWQDDGSWITVVKIPAGMQDNFYNLVNRLTKGEAETKLLR